MDTRALLKLFDEQMRRRIGPVGGESAERDERVTRVISADGWSGVVWSDLAGAGADAAIAEQISRFAALGQPWEWKHYSHDQPPDLPERLRAAGFLPGEPEALLVAETAALALDTAPPPGVTLAEVTGQRGAGALVAVHDEVFGGDHSAIGRAVLAGLTRQPPSAAGVVALAGHAPIAGGRVEFHAGTDFASLWGGGTLAEWRGRGVFRSLVAYRAALAAARGFRYVQVDALPASAPILRRLGFAQLATTTPFTHPGGARPGGSVGGLDDLYLLFARSRLRCGSWTLRVSAWFRMTRSGRSCSRTSVANLRKRWHLGWSAVFTTLGRPRFRVWPPSLCST
jgi:ribosomal protein S18 acetylase RimI-like enzyme